jgi:hypothetical protein
MNARYVSLLYLPALAAVVLSCASTQNRLNKGEGANSSYKTRDFTGQIAPANGTILNKLSCLSVARNKRRRFSRERLLGEPVSEPLSSNDQARANRETDDHPYSRQKRSTPTYADNISACTRTESRQIEPKSRKQIRNTILWVLGLNLFYFGIFRNLKTFTI